MPVTDDDAELRNERTDSPPHWRAGWMLALVLCGLGIGCQAPDMSPGADIGLPPMKPDDEFEMPRSRAWIGPA